MATMTRTPVAAERPGRKPADGAPRQHGRVGRRGWTGWLFIAPNLVGMVAFTLVPLVSAVLIAFTDWDVASGLSGITFVGLANFTELMGDGRFWHSVGLTSLYAGISVPLSIALGLCLAMALNRPVPGRGALRVIFFLPHIVNQVAVGMTWLLVLNPSAGLVNRGLKVLGFEEPPLWLASSDWALPALILMAVWGGVGYVAVIYLAALQDMPTELYEQAAIDGAGPLRRFTTLTWPALVPTTLFLLITLFIGVSQSFGLIVLLTQGGPGDSTQTLAYFTYQTGFEFYRFGYASAVGMVTFLGMTLLTLLLWRLQRGRALHDD